MKRKFMSILLSGMMIFSMASPGLTVSAAEIETKDPSAVEAAMQEGANKYGDFEYSVSDSTVEITGYTGTEESVEIPETINGQNVTSIGESAFSYCVNLKSVTIPDSVTSVGNSAFYYCKSLTSIDIPNSVTSIGDKAFYYCESLTSAAIPNSVISIGSEAFDSCKSLTSIDIPNSVTSIGKSAFHNCKSLTRVKIPDSITVLSKGTFSMCSGLTSVTLPNSVTDIEDSAFADCKSLTEITIPSSVTLIGNNSFAYCKSLKSITLSDESSLTSIGNLAFINCSEIEEIIIPSYVTVIGESAFRNCTKLKSVSVMSSATEIKSGAFNSSDLIIYSYKNSKAALYSMNNGIEFSAFDYDELENLSTVDKDAVIIKNNVKITGDAKGGSGEYQYAFYYKRGNVNNWTIKSAFGKSKSVVLCPTYADTYTVRVDVKDSKGSVRSKTHIVNSVNKFENTSTISEKSVITGEEIIVKGNVSGGFAPYQYAFFYKGENDKEWTTEADYGKATSIVFTPEYADKYTVRVVAKDSIGTESSKEFTVIALDELENLSTASAEHANIDDVITIKGDAKGGSGDYQYAFYYKRGNVNNWTTKAEYEAKATSVTLNPQYADDYKVKVVVKDSNGTEKEKVLSISTKIKVTLTADKTSVMAKSSFTVTASAIGGRGDYQYAFDYKKNNEKSFTKKSDFSKAASVTFNPQYAATYHIKVIVIDSSGNQTEETVQIETYPELKNESTVSAESVKVGEKVIISGAAAGGKGDYQYSIYFSREKEPKTTLKLSYGEGTSAIMFPGYADTYTIYVSVKDSDNNVVEKKFTLTVNPKS